MYIKCHELKAERADAARSAFDAARGDAKVRLLQREDGSELLTWMENHSSDPPQVQRQTADAMAPFIEGTRHIARFAPLP